MERFEICSVTKEKLDAVRPLITKEAAEAIEEGIPAAFLCAIKDKAAIGALCGGFVSNVFEIDSIYVAQQYRRQGVGRALLKELFMMIDDMDRSGDTGLVVQAEFSLIDSESLTLPPFFSDMGFRRGEVFGPAFYKATLDDFAPQIEPHEKDSKRICSFSSLSDKEKTAFSASCEKGDYPVPEDGLFSDKVDLDASLIMFDENGKGSYVCLEELGGSEPEKEDDASSAAVRRLRIHYMSQAHPGDVVLMFTEMMDKLKKEGNPDTEVFFLAAEESDLKQIKRLFPDVKGCSERYMLYEIPNEEDYI